jgi:transcriptional regulator with XRE-family HTH domain
MAARKKPDDTRNDALAVLTQMFGETEGWDERVAAATEAALIAEEVYALRERHGLTQAALADLIDSSQSAVARLENATYHGHSISVLRRIAAAVGERVIVRFMATTDTATPRRPASKKRPARKEQPVALVEGGIGNRKPPARRGPAPTHGKKVTA